MMSPCTQPPSVPLSTPAASTEPTAIPSWETVSKAAPPAPPCSRPGRARLLLPCTGTFGNGLPPSGPGRPRPAACLGGRAHGRAGKGGPGGRDFPKNSRSVPLGNHTADEGMHLVGAPSPGRGSRVTHQPLRLPAKHPCGTCSGAERLGHYIAPTCRVMCRPRAPRGRKGRAEMRLNF